MQQLPPMEVDPKATITAKYRSYNQVIRGDTLPFLKISLQGKKQRANQTKLPVGFKEYISVNI